MGYSEVIEKYKDETEESYNKSLGIIFDGKNNLRSLAIENIIDNSPTASQCAGLYESFLVGAGFEVDLSQINLSDDPYDPQNPNDLLFESGEVVSRHEAVCILVGYNANFEKDHYKIVPYTLCRKGKKDSKDYVGKILVSKLGWGKQLKKKDIQVYDTYNPRPEVIAEQVIRDGGWNNYKGQILFFRMSDKYDYPKSLIEGALNFADTEIELGEYYRGATSRGFEDVTFIRHNRFPTPSAKNEFYSNMKKVSGVKASGSKVLVEDQFDDDLLKEGNFRFDTLPNTTKAEKFKHFEESAANFIRKKFHNIPTQLIDYISGKLGNSSGEDLKVAQAIYNSSISRKQEKMEMLFKELFRNYKFDINPTNNWTIKQYSLLDNGTINYENKDGLTTKTAEDLNAEAIRKAQAELRGSVGGVTTILALQQSVGNKTTTPDSGIAILVNVYGFEEQVARDILGAPKETIPPTDPPLT